VDDRSLALQSRPASHCLLLHCDYHDENGNHVISDPAKIAALVAVALPEQYDRPEPH
jgi:hypothetical protein